MTDLSLNNINKNAPYLVVNAKKEGFYEFLTLHGVHYSVGFMNDNHTMMPTEEAYHLIIANVNHHKSPSDIKVRDTVLSIVDEFFAANNYTLLYLCETGDKKQAMRSRLFERWFSTYKHRALFTFMTSSIMDADGQVNYATIILRNDNPRLTQIIESFTTTITLLSQKPDETT